MNAELIGVGTELLLGQIANTNAQTISSKLASIGVDVYFHTVVGDNLARMSETLQRAFERADVVIVTGGLGPTPDDITREGVAEATGRQLHRDERLADQIKSIFERLGRPMPEENLRQADLPQGALPIAPEGTAPGFFIESPDCLVFALPGVPWEMEAMLDKTVIPNLRERGPVEATISREILVVGLGESHTHQLIADIVDAQSNPTIAYLAGGGRVRVRVTAKAAGEAEALALIEPVEAEIRSRLGANVVPGHEASLAAALGKLCLDRDLKVAAAESLTGGLIGAQLSEAPGSSEYFAGSVVSYSNEAKRDVLGVERSILEGPGAVSVEAARAMAEGACDLFRAELGLSATGVAGPTEQEGKPVGTIFVAAAMDDRTEVREVKGYGDRDNIRSLATTAALDLARRVVQNRE